MELEPQSIEYVRPEIVDYGNLEELAAEKSRGIPYEYHVLSRSYLPVVPGSGDEAGVEPDRSRGQAH